MKPTTGTGVKVAGFSAGLIAVATALTFALSAWHVPRGAGTLGTDVTFVAAPTGELQMTPGAFVRGVGLRPGQSAQGTVTVRNITAQAMDVSVQALPSISDLDALLQVRVTAGPRTVFEGTLGGLTAGTTTSFTLARGQSRPLSVRVWLPAGVDDGYQGRIDDVSLALDVQPSGV